MSWTGMLALAAAQATPLERDLLQVADLSWRPVHDTVMGGRSSGTVELGGDGVRFEGTLSLKNNGGFASIRGESDGFDLQRTEGLQLEVVGDGRVWFVTIDRSDVRLRAGSYRATIQTRDGEATIHNLQWTEFQPTSFGRPVVGVPALGSAPERIRQIGFMVADGQAGDFNVEVRSIRPLAPSSAAPVPRPVVVEDGGVGVTFIRAIELGVPAFNRGDADVCRAHYQTAVETALMLSADRLSDDQIRRLRAALETAAIETDVEAAWTLRRAMDGVLAATAQR